MKLLFTSFIMGLALASHAQTQQWGQVYFANHILPSPPDRLIRLMASGRPLVGTNFVAELYYGCCGLGQRRRRNYRTKLVQWRRLIFSKVSALHLCAAAAWFFD